MKAKKYVNKSGFLKLLIILGFISIGNFSFAQDSTATGSSMGRMDLPNPTSIENLYTYDPITDRYIYTQKLGSFKINYPGGIPKSYPTGRDEGVFQRENRCCRW